MQIIGISECFVRDSPVAMYIFQDDQRAVDASYSVVANPGMDGGHARILDFWSHYVAGRQDCGY